MPIMRFATNLDNGVLGMPDSEELWADVWSHIPESVLTNKKSKFLFPAIGHGTELKVLCGLLKERGWTKRQIINACHIVDKYRVFTNPIRAMGFKNVYTENFLEWETDMKFDVVVGNPPYQNAGTAEKLWPLFVKKITPLLKENGYIAFITPSMWVYRAGSKSKEVRHLAESMGIIYVNLNVTDPYFPTVGVDITAFVLGTAEETTVVTKAGIKVLKSATLKRIADSTKDPIIVSIFNKIESSSVSRLPVKRDLQSRPTVQPMYKKTPTKKYKYAVHHTATQKYYVDKLYGDKDKLKVIINITGHYYHPKNPEKYIFLSNDMTGKGMMHVLVKSATEGKRLIKLLRSKLYRFYIEEERTSGFVTGLPKLPYLDTTTNWTDQELYEYFNLTQEEIDLIEATIK